MEIKKVPLLKNAAGFRERISALGLELPIEDAIEKAPESPLAAPLDIGGFKVGNRYAVHPMEGWDTTHDGKPTPDLIRRWERFAESGAKFIWGFEAMAVRHDGRANPNQLVLNEENAPLIRAAVDRALEVHAKRFGTVSDLLWGYQLTHSGRFSRPNAKTVFEPSLAYRHPIIDRKYKVADDQPVMTDDEVRRLIEDYVNAAVLAEKSGVPFVDVKQCHGYLGHEFLSAYTRKGPYGGETLEERSRFAREIIAGIRQAAPSLIIGVRLSAFDWVPFKKGEQGSASGVPEEFKDLLPYRYGFGINQDNPVEMNLAEPIQYLRLLKQWGVAVVNASCGSPYYNPHIQRPASSPPSDGYQPPEDPLVGVARQAGVVRELKKAVPEMPLVSSGLTYLQEFLPQVGQALVRQGWTDSLGIGRMMLSYPGIVADSLEKGAIETKKICRTFSDCTTAPRNGIKSGCYPLDEYYKVLPEFTQLKEIKQAERAAAQAAKAASVATTA
jgi:NADPH2 dehydrogenase